jgi:two-component system cell cycle sensor histidine kinase/response regulator CckA
MAGPLTIAPPSAADSLRPPPAPPRGLSIRWKFLLFIGGLVAAVTIAFGGAAYRAMRESAVSATSVRLDGIAAQWARLFEGSVARQSAAFRATGGNPAVQEALARRDSVAFAAAAPALRGLIPPGQSSAVQLLDPDRAPLLVLGDTAAAVNGPVPPGVLDRAATSDSVIVGTLRARGQAVVGSYALRLTVNGVVAGYLAQTTQLHLTPSPEELNKLFGGGTTRVRLTNRDGSLWTDLERPLPLPSVPVDFSLHPLSYQSPVTGPVFAAARPIAGTPWLVVLESSEAEVLGPSRRLERSLLIEGALAIGLGILVAIAMSGPLTRNLARLTESAEEVASGNYSHLTGVSPRGDELGRLALAFDTMVTRLEQAFAAQRAAEAYYRGLFEAIPLPTWLYDRETLAILAVNDAAIRHYGYQREEFLAMTVADLRLPEDVPLLRDAIRESAGVEYQQGDWRHRKKDGTVIEVEVHARTMTFRGRNARLVVIHDVTERQEAQERIRRLDERYRRLIQESSSGITLSKLDGSFLAVNPAFVRMLGYDSEAEVFALAPPERIYANPEEQARLRAALAATGQVRNLELHLRRKDDKVITVQIAARVVTEAGSSEPYLETAITDVTELRRVERQFQQAQKMEAVGQLAGGVAHDFNNLLTVVLSYCDLLLAEADLAGLNREAVEAIRGAGISAATLTRQLLVFSRQEVVQQEVMYLNKLITGTGNMLARLIGEQVELATTLAPDAGAVKVDPGQLEQVIVNLAVNARDAMPDGGRLLIESRNVEIHASGHEADALIPPGAYVLLVVSDNGVGMDAATQARIFEPFFTTKEPGKGTGLGLATVYGIVKQSGGHIAVYSELGKGTSFKIYLPRMSEAATTPRRLADSPDSAGGSETILLVEDEIKLRALVCRILEPKGYRVLAAADGDAALGIVVSHAGPIDLLLTDVVMPGMSGRVLADRALKLRPDMRVLFMSGYTDDAIVHHGVLESGMQFIEKPFAGKGLAKKVRQVLDASRS